MPTRHDAVTDRPYWTVAAPELLARLATSPTGLTGDEARARLAAQGPNLLDARARSTTASVLRRQFQNPLLLLLLFAAGAGMLAGEWVDGSVALAIALATVFVSFFRERSAQTAIDALRSRLALRASVLRDGTPCEIALAELVVGDVVRLAAGSIVPADARILEATELYVSEAALTGESLPVRKRVGVIADPQARLAARENCVFLGTNVRSGTATCVVVATGRATAYGAVAHRLTQRPTVTDFERGLRRFGYLLTGAMLAIALAIAGVHVLSGRAAIDSLLFAVALALGLSPELLPAILGLTLARGAKALAQHGVLVRRLGAIQNLGSMDVLCTDKTGTLTEGEMRLDGAYDATGARSDAVLALAAVNAACQTGIASPLDAAILQQRQPQADGTTTVAEVPFDFERRRVSVFVRVPEGVRLITKGAFPGVLACCTYTGDGAALDATARAALTARYDAWTEQGLRVLAIASRTLPAGAHYGREDETALGFAGFLTFLDRPKPDIERTLADLAALGVRVKIVTGDSVRVARHLAALVGLDASRSLVGTDIDALDDSALADAAGTTTIFAEADPGQKERLVRALRASGHVVGFLGDGVNDAPAMYAADVSVSVDEAVDVAREAADFVLLERSLDVLRSGIEGGRRTFANTLKYLLTTTSANFGNMVSMALAAVVLPFLPMTAGQILLNNFLSDVPAVGVADDRVDAELLAKPQRWDIRFLGRFIAEFGLLSSAFDLLLFAGLAWLYRSSPEVFRTTWFVESLLTELAVALVVRTRRPFYRSRPGSLLLVSTLAMMVVAFVLPFVPDAALFGLVPLPPPLLAAVALVTLLYVLATETLKHRFYSAH